MSQVPPPDDPPPVPIVEPPLVVPPEVSAGATYVREERVVSDGTPLAESVDVNAVHEEERVRVLPDGTMIRERDRIEQRSRFRDWLPWLLLALLGLVLVIGLIVWYVNRSSSKTVPAVVGLRIDAAVNRLQQDGFKVEIARQSSTRSAGTVFGQNPAAGTSHSDGSSVRLLVAKGRTGATVPNAVGLAQAAARDRLVRAGFRVTATETSSDQPRGSVVSQSPAAGGHLTSGGLIHLIISKGSATVNVPSEVGNPVTQARSELAALGLKPDVSHVPSTQPVDTVVAQNPPGGQARKGSTVYLNVSKGAPATTAPKATPTTTVQTTTTQTTTTQTTTTATTATVTVPKTQTTTVTTPATAPAATSTTP
jgi:beta-lactam-binding protein with PASTA domain